MSFWDAIHFANLEKTLKGVKLQPRLSKARLAVQPLPSAPLA